MKNLFLDVNGKVSSKRTAGWLLLINALAMAWFAIVTNNSAALGSLITLISGAVVTLSATVAEKKQ